LLNQTFKFGQNFGDWNFDELFEGSKYAPEYECGGIPRDEPPPHAYITPWLTSKSPRVPTVTILTTFM